MNNKWLFSAVTLLCAGILSGCMAKDVPYSEQQQRMARCDQYIERERDMCLRGEAVTIEDFNEDFKDYKKSRAEEGEDVSADPVLPVVVEPEDGK